MQKKSQLSQCLAVAFGAYTAMPAVAQDVAPQTLERVEITGSSIKRVDAEGSLPVTVITRADIERSGATSATDLIQQLSSMQGFLTQSSSVNGGGGGATNASIHDIGSQYTLVLLNGRRMAPYNTGTTINLNSIPLAAIERVEVLTDGASALYGADAIAGVVNFVLRRDSTEGVLTATGTVPQHSGGGSYNAALTKGFGDLDKDKFNVMASLSYDKQKELASTQRDFSKSGIRSFTDQGRSLTTYFTSSNSVPANVYLLTPDGSNLAAQLNPYLLKNGSCASGTVLRSGICRYDYGAHVDDIPASERTSLFGSGRLKVAPDATLFTEVALSRFENTPAFASPAQPNIYLTQALYNKDVAPYLSQLGLTSADIAPVGDSSGNGPYMNLRLADAGQRQDRYKTDTQHFVFGAEASYFDWDSTAYYTHSVSKFTDTAMGGYMSTNYFNSVVASGAFDPLDSTPGQAASVLAPGVLHEVLDSSESKIDVINLKASRSIFKLPAGDVSMGLGLEYNRQSYVDNPSAISQGLSYKGQDTAIGGSAGELPLDATRHSMGEFLELIVPVTKVLELSGAARHDNFSAVKDSKNYDVDGNPIASATEGISAGSNTYKISFRLQPSKEVLFRGSYGTGFKAPTLANIANKVSAYGVTSGSYNCPFTAEQNAEFAAACIPGGAAQYNESNSGNPASGSGALKPEKSTQWSFGARLEPLSSLSFGADVWDVLIRDRIDSVAEQVAFANGPAYESLFAVVPDPNTGKKTLTYLLRPSNLGKAHYSGIDMDAIGRTVTPAGRLTVRGSATYMIKADYEIPGLPGYQTSMGQYGPDQAVTFRWQANAGVTLDSGDFSNTFNIMMKPGYRDATQTVASGYIRVLNADGTVGAATTVSRRVASYNLVDWQGKYNYSKVFSFTLGIKNIFDKNPPFSLQNAGGGNALGYDGRYTDPTGRAFYLTGNAKF